MHTLTQFAATLCSMALLLSFALTTPVKGQPIPEGVSAADAATPEAAQVLTAVDALFDAMRNRDGDAARAVLHPDARMTVVRADADTALPDVQTTDGFVDALESGDTPWNEPYFDPEVRIDGDLAHVWMFFQFYEGDTFSHCGSNSIQLLHDSNVWRITFIAYTHRTTDCRRE
ncbi:MAG: nuclear transport factor 2 family protein [Longimonas sp.]|uniref:nuclear transport factor 2 family protein n=1 Tax=Longimonas sp. TaxID=2039626 RepID=UPI00335D8B42